MSMQLSLVTIAEVLGCELPSGADNVTIKGAVIDSRQIETANLFIALKGERVDGHDYIETARLAGAFAALVSVKQDDELAQLVVEDVAKAFAQLTTYWRQQCTAKFIAVTGSNGKTTVKEMLASILTQCGSVIATKGNLNNELGVPLTLARVDADTDYAVIEMGASRAGDIETLVAIAKPDISIINNVAAAHLEGFNNIQGVAKAKAEIFEGLSEQGIGVINADMDFVEQWQQILADKHSVTFALENDADIRADDIQLSGDSSHFMVKLNDEFHYINLPLLGLHNVANALAAIAITHALSIPTEAIVKGLAAMQSVPHRLQLRAGLNGSQLIDDSYNANPGSYKQALLSLAPYQGQHWLVLGDLGELGSESKQLHHQMGLDAKESGIDRLWTLGSESKLAADAFGSGAQHFEDRESLQAQLSASLSSDVTCLIKGSRFMKLDLLADALTRLGDG